MKFLVDMPMSPAVADWLNEQGHTATHAYHLGLGKASDEEILRQATKDDRIVIPCDLDFPRLLALTEAAGPSVILLRGGNYSEVEALELPDRILQSIPEQALRPSIIVADRKRLRRHRLPLKPS